MTDSSTRHASPESRQRCQSFRTAFVIACASDSSWRRVSVSRWRRTSFNAQGFPNQLLGEPLDNSESAAGASAPELRVHSREYLISPLVGRPSSSKTAPDRAIRRSRSVAATYALLLARTRRRVRPAIFRSHREWPRRHLSASGQDVLPRPPEWRLSPAAAGHWYKAAQRLRRNHLRPKLGVPQRPAKFRSFQCEDRQPQAPWALWPDQNKLPARLASSDKT